MSRSRQHWRKLYPVPAVVCAAVPCNDAIDDDAIDDDKCAT